MYEGQGEAPRDSFGSVLHPAKSFSDAHSSEEEQASPINEVEEEEAEDEQELEADPAVGPEEEEKEEVKDQRQSSVGSLYAQYS